MDNNTRIYIGLDTHKASTEVAYAFSGRDERSVHFGKIKTTKPALIKLARQFVSKYPNAPLHLFTKPAPVATGSIAY